MVKFFYNFFTGKIILDLFQNNMPLDFEIEMSLSMV